MAPEKGYQHSIMVQQCSNQSKSKEHAGHLCSLLTGGPASSSSPQQGSYKDASEQTALALPMQAFLPRLSLTSSLLCSDQHSPLSWPGRDGLNDRQDHTIYQLSPLTSKRPSSFWLGVRACGIPSDVNTDPEMMPIV